MNRRKFISSGAFFIGGGVAMNAFSRSALAFEATIEDNISIPEDVNDPKINLKFDKFQITARNVENVTIKLNASLEGNELIKNVDSVNKTLDNPNGRNNLDSISLVISKDSTSKIDLESRLSEKTENETLNLNVEIIVENPDIESVSTGKKNIDISISSRTLLGPKEYYESGTPTPPTQTGGMNIFLDSNNRPSVADYAVSLESVGDSTSRGYVSYDIYLDTSNIQDLYLYVETNVIYNTGGRVSIDDTVWLETRDNLSRSKSWSNIKYGSVGNSVKLTVSHDPSTTSYDYRRISIAYPNDGYGNRIPAL